MTNITREVQRFLDHDAAIRRDLARGIVNRRALASYVRKHLHAKAGIDAIISAIRRYETEAREEGLFAKAGALIRHAKVSTKTGIAIISLLKDSGVQEVLPRLFSAISYGRGEIIRIIQADESIKVIVDEKNVDKVTGMVNKSSVVSVKNNVAEINMRLTEISGKVPGVLAMLDTELANNSISILETCSCVPEVLWFFEQKDLLNAHKTFMELIESLR